MGVADNFSQALLKIQSLTNTAQQAAERKVVPHSICAKEGWVADMDAFARMRYGRQIVNAEVSPCAKLACATLDSIRKSRIGQFKIGGEERKNTWMRTARRHHGGK